MPPLTQPPPSTPEGPADAGLEHVGSTLRQMVGRFFKDSALYGLSSFASMSIGIVLIPILSRVFLPKDFGIIEMIASFIAIAVPLSRCGMDAAYGRFYYDAETPEERRINMGTAAIFMLAWSALVVVACLAARGLAAKLLFAGERVYLPAFVFAAVSLPALLCADMFNNLLRFMMQTKRFIYLAVGRSVLVVAFTLLLVVLLRQSVPGVYAARLFATLAAVIWGFWLVRDQFRWRFSPASLKAMLVFGFPFLPSALLNIAIQYSDRWFINHYLNLEQVGIYAMTVRISQIFGLVSSGVLLAWPPMVLLVYKQGKAEQFLPKAILYTVIAGSIAVVLLGLFAREALAVLATPAYYSASRLVAGYSLALLLNLAISVAAAGMLIMKKTGYWLVATIAKAVCVVGLNFLLVPWLGPAGAVVSFLLGQVVALVIVFRESQRLYPVVHSARPYIVMSVLVTIFVSGASLFAGSASLPAIFAKVTAFAAFLLLLWRLVLDDAERRSLRDKVQSLVPLLSRCKRSSL